jgi:hypothetical protein
MVCPERRGKGKLTAEVARLSLPHARAEENVAQGDASLKSCGATVPTQQIITRASVQIYLLEVISQSA